MHMRHQTHIRGGLETARNMKTQKSGGERGRRDEARERKDARPSQLYLNSALSCHNADIWHQQAHHTCSNTYKMPKLLWETCIRYRTAGLILFRQYSAHNDYNQQNEGQKQLFWPIMKSIKVIQLSEDIHQSHATE